MTKKRKKKKSRKKKKKEGRKEGKENLASSSIHFPSIQELVSIGNKIRAIEKAGLSPVFVSRANPFSR